MFISLCEVSLYVILKDCLIPVNCRIYVDLPDAENRLKILKIFLTPENLEPGFQFEKLAKETEGYSGSDLKVGTRFQTPQLVVCACTFLIHSLFCGFYISESMHCCCLQTCSRTLTGRTKGTNIKRFHIFFLLLDCFVLFVSSG